MIILVPSYKRAGNVLVRKWLSDCVLCVHEFEAEDYERKEAGSIEVIPDSLRGNMSRIRNWMLDYGYSKDERVVMMDDDVYGFGYMEKGKPIAVDASRFRDFLEVGYQMAEDIGVKLWGVNLQSDPLFYRCFSPILLNVPVLGTFSCHLKNNLRYDERLSLNEDYDFFLQHCLKYRKVLRFDKWHYKARHLDMAGGCAAYRTLDEEKAQADIMIKKWGSKVVKYDFTKSTNPIVKVPF